MGMTKRGHTRRTPFGELQTPLGIWAKTMIRGFVFALGGFLLAAEGMAAASDFYLDHRVDYFASGKHLFYVWCPGTNGYLANAEGANAEEAQIRLYSQTKATGEKCWPVWQGRVRSGLVVAQEQS
jgi:hypothetical protein